MPEITGEKDSRGKTSLAEAKLLSPVETFETLSGDLSEGFSVPVGSWQGILVETNEVETKSTWPKDSSKVSSKDGVSMPARATLLFPNPSR